MSNTLMVGTGSSLGKLYWQISIREGVVAYVLAKEAPSSPAIPVVVGNERFFTKTQRRRARRAQEALAAKLKKA
jgi:hypothetical protein